VSSGGPDPGGSGPGEERYVIRGGHEGYRRLKVLARAAWPGTAEFLDRVGVHPGMRCIDIGCGSGDVTFELARMAGPDGRVTGIDMDEVKLALARDEAAERGMANVEFRSANVNEWDEPGAFDVVYSRLLLQHLRQPVDLLRRMWAAVRPGGTIAVEDADFDALFCHPPNDGFAFWARAYPETLRRHGGDPTMGRKLFTCFLEAGIPPPELTLTQRVDRVGEAKTLPLLTIEATAESILADGIATEEAIRTARVSFAPFAQDPTTLVGGPRMFHAFSRRDQSAG